MDKFTRFVRGERDGMLHIFYCVLQSGVFLKIKGFLM